MNARDMGPTAFATSEALERSELETAPVRYPRPSALEAVLSFEGAKMRRAAEALGLETVGDLLEHLPRDRREARAVAELVPGETATVVVQVSGIASRPVRRRGMRPLVEATVADGTGALKVTFFNQPWLVERYPVGTRLVLHGKFDGRRALRRAGATRAPSDADSGGRRDAVAHYPATEGLSSTQILALVRAHARRVRRRRRAAAGRAARRASACRPRGGAAAAHFPRADAGPGARARAGSRSRSCCSPSLRCCAAGAAARRRRRARPTGSASRELTARWLGGTLPFALTGDQRAALERDRRRPRARRCRCSGC